MWSRYSFFRRRCMHGIISFIFAISKTSNITIIMDMANEFFFTAIGAWLLSTVAVDDKRQWISCNSQNRSLSDYRRFLSVANEINLIWLIITIGVWRLSTIEFCLSNRSQMAIDDCNFHPHSFFFALSLYHFLFAILQHNFHGRQQAIRIFITNLLFSICWLANQVHQLRPCRRHQNVMNYTKILKNKFK